MRKVGDTNAGRRKREGSESADLSSVREDTAARGLLHIRAIAQLFESANIGALLLLHGTIRSTNLLARTILRHGDGLYDNQGSLAAQSPADDRVLQHLIATVLSPNRRSQRDGTLVVRRPTRRPLVVQLHSMTLPPDADSGPSFPAALVLIRDPEFIPSIDGELVAAVLGLSSVESRMVVLLSTGRSVREIADVVHRSVHTVRWTLKNVYAKTRCAGQVELVRLIGRLTGDIVPPAGEEPRWVGAQSSAIAKSSPRE